MRNCWNIWVFIFHFRLPVE